MDLTKALLNLRPGAIWTIDGNTYEGITWLDTNQTKPTRQEVNAELQAQLSEIQRTEYKRQRELEYPSFAEQFDILYHSGYDEWRSTIQAVKDKHPKP